ncbi:Uncharacterized conserved protein, implicated in type VI secretion and phage assembly [Mesonia phycicola]|uniref:Uncharacterized conserved protein, implicated in type VI secretion and phage assembly n=1 Tax=Mesonia phycicola TaxID=579105 RepID=A0A1M6FYN1_9FLAO|nr:phage baseplate assembly protein V [Mesonia phycicola]SHJ02855.1 Uncharacterized conserved protein, implicated in type VI secretion and phage assembly [Mesonia phycicola]
MALQSTISIYIAGNSIPAFQEFSLHQTLGSHHSFELVCRMDVLEKVTLGGLAEDSKNHLGETFTFQVNAIDEFSGYKTLEFKGLVTSINSLKAFNHKNGDLVIIGGHSTTILAEDGGHYSSHNEVTLKDILDKTFAGYDKGKLETAFQPNTTAPLHYSVQNNESSWQYTARLASQYSEWFYYNGKKLVFGTPEKAEPIELTYGHDLQEFSMELNPQPNKFNYFTNDYLNNEYHQKNTAEVSKPSGYNGFSSEKAATLYSKETNIFINNYNDPTLKKRLDSQVEQQKKTADQRQVTLKGVSDNPGVGLGKTIKIKGQDEHYGSYIVTKVNHIANENGRYQNTFEAVSADIDVYPLTNFNAIPRSETQTAIVTENIDPEGMGRIKVQFYWQKMTGEMTPWIRVITPHSGADKGFHFIPEIGEEVLIGFEGGNAERPYVMGSLYHGSHRPQSWKTDKNDIKAIRTRSGHTFELNDANGSESITITDKNGNVIRIDTANNDIMISALENMTLNAKNMQINVEENMDVSIGKNKSENITETSFITANNEDKQISEEIKILSSTYKQEAQEITTDASGEIKTNAGGKITIASAETVNYGE